MSIRTDGSERRGKPEPETKKLSITKRTDPMRTNNVFKSTTCIMSSKMLWYAQTLKSDSHIHCSCFNFLVKCSIGNSTTSKSQWLLLWNRREEKKKTSPNQTNHSTFEMKKYRVFFSSVKTLAHDFKLRDWTEKLLKIKRPTKLIAELYRFFQA